MEQCIKYSYIEQKPIEIIYLSRQGQFSQRKITVKSIDNGHLVAYCFIRKQMRVFSLSQILSASRSTNKRVS